MGTNSKGIQRQFLSVFSANNFFCLLFDLLVARLKAVMIYIDRAHLVQRNCVLMRIAVYVSLLAETHYS